MKSAHQAVHHKHAQWQVVHEGRGVVAKNFLCLSVGVFYCAPALANILVLLVQEAAGGCQVVFALLLALVNIFLWLPLPPPPVANQGQLGRQEGLSPCEG